MLRQQIDPFRSISDGMVLGLIHTSSSESGLTLVGLDVKVIEDVNLHRFHRTER